MLPYPLSNFEKQVYQNEPAVKQAQWSHNDVYSRNNLPKVKDGAYAVNLYGTNQ